jgi:ferredoxin-thioredoxin reductase catalytic chain
MDDKEVTINEWAQEYAASSGFKLNPDEKALDRVFKGLVRNNLKFGARYCPCRVKSGDKEKDKDIICPCVFHKKEIEDQGSCHCYLFFNGSPSAEGEPLKNK